MSIRESINKYPAVSTGVVIAVLAVAIVLILHRSGGEPVMAGASQTYFSDDDGKTYFADDASKLPPFDHGGRTAYLAGVFQYGNGKPFVAYLIRYTPEAKAKLETFSPAEVNSSDARVNEIKRDGREIQRPGDRKWIASTATEFDEYLQPRRTSKDVGIAAQLQPS